MSFEWDSNKEEENICKHGVNFTAASQIWDGWVFERVDDRRDYGEVRFFSLWQDRRSGTGRRVYTAWNGTPHHFRSKGKSP